MYDKNNWQKCGHDGCTEYALSFSEPRRCAEHLVEIEGWQESLKKEIQKAHKRGECLENINLKHAHLENLNLYDINLSNSLLDDAIFEFSRLYNAYFTNVHARNCNFEFTELQKANFIEVDFSGSNLASADLRFSYLMKSDLSNCELDQTKLHGTRLVRTKLQGANFLYINNFYDDNFKNPKIFEEQTSDAIEGYRLIKNNFIQTGKYEDASWASFKEMKFRSKEKRKKNFFYFIPSFFMEYSCGYGEKPMRILIWSLFLILFFASFYFCFGFYENSGTAPETKIIRVTNCWPIYSKENLSLLSKSIYYSTITFTTLGYSHVMPSCNAGKFLTAFEAFLGAFTMAQLAWVFGKRYSGR